ncbi:hypothetical protein D3C76_1138010 [compost metagenome]
MNPSGPGRLDHLHRIDLGEASDVFTEGAFEQFNVLGQVTDIRPKLVLVPSADVGAIKPNHPVLRGPDAQQRPGQCRLSRRAGTDDAHHAAGRCAEADVLENRRPGTGGRDNQVLDLHMPLGRRQRHALGLRLLLIEDVVQAVVLRASGDKPLPATNDQVDGRQRTSQQYGPGEHQASPDLIVHG